MSRKLTTEEFVERAEKVHGKKYDYSKVNYKGYEVEVCIICPEHGEFWQTPNNHLFGSGCPLCYKEKKSLGRDLFVSKSQEIHGNKYDYSKAAYKTNKDKVCIICPEHGEFLQRPDVHLRGNGCPKCNPYFLDAEKFISKGKQIHNNFYDYSKVDYQGVHSKVCIVCPIHGEFLQTPDNHLRGQGCPECGRERVRNKLQMGDNLFIEIANNKYNGFFDYSLVKYKNNSTKVKIICPKHGVFEQTPSSHLYTKFGCPTCAQEELMKNRRTVGINDVLDSSKEPYYIKWVAMLARCYFYKNNSYKGCSVCDEWLTLSKFKEWWSKNYIEGWQLDKDILVKGNRIYSPQTCCFVPQEINAMFTKRVLSGDKKSVFPHKDGYGCLISRNNKTIRIYGFKTREEALAVHKKELEKHIHDLADKYKEQLAPNVYNILSTYKI